MRTGDGPSSDTDQRTSAPRQLVGQVAAPLRAYLGTETGSATLLLAATLVALGWANSPWADGYTAFWGTELSIGLGDAELVLDLKHWVNDGLMVFFFFVVGLEVKRELAIGELRDRRRAAVPAAAAVLGLLVPALLYLAVNPAGEAARGWGVVISTDTAFLLGVLALVGPACPTQLRIFLLTLAVADDVGALTIIALFYTEDLSWGPLALSALGIALMIAIRGRVWRGPPYFVIAVGVWIAMYESGVHPTIAGVVIALFTPAFLPDRERVEEARQLGRAFGQSPDSRLGRAARLSVERAISPNERLQLLYHPWSSYLIVPVFALANAGVTLDAESLRLAAASPVTIGVVTGLVVGKGLGITVGALLAMRLRIGVLAPGVDPPRLAASAFLSGIGFTISLFIVDLAFEDPELADQARIGVLAGSLLAALTGWVMFRVADRLTKQAPTERRDSLLPPVDPDRDHIRGPATAPLTLVEYGDFECPFCGRATGSVTEVIAHFGDQLRYVFRHVPLTDVHAHAELAAQAAEAAGAQGRFWEMHDLLFAHQDALEGHHLMQYAEQLGLDVDSFAEDLRAGAHASRVQEDVAGAEASGVRSTPTFFIAGRRHDGRYDAATLIDALTASRAQPVVGSEPVQPSSGSDRD